MRQSLWLALIRLASVVALAASTALLLDYTSPSAAFCGPGSGCEAVRRSGYGYYLLGEQPIPVPVFGLVGFGLLFAATFLRLPTRARVVPALGLGGGVVSLYLLWLQLTKVGQFCTLCVVVDVAALIAAVSGGLYAALALRAEPRAAEATPLELRNWAWLALAFVAVVAPLSWTRLRPAPPVPAEVLKLYVPGKINVVEFADFECPFCRLLHDRLKSIVASYPDRVHFVRLNMPLDRHTLARGAAYAWICAEQQGKGEAMADALFKALDLSPDANRRAAEKLGLNLEAFDRCVKAPETAARVDRESKILRDAGFKGLPTTYVGAHEIVGAQSEEVFRDAFERAARGSGDRGVPGPAFVAILGVVLVALVWYGRAGYTSTWEPEQSKNPARSKSPST